MPVKFVLLTGATVSFFRDLVPIVSLQPPFRFVAPLARAREAPDFSRAYVVLLPNFCVTLRIAKRGQRVQKFAKLSGGKFNLRQRRQQLRLWGTLLYAVFGKVFRPTMRQ